MSAVLDRTDAHELTPAQLAQRVNDILADWHSYAAAYSYGHGYPSEDIACRLYRASRQYDDDNGALDAHAWLVQMQAVDHIIDEIQQPMRTAIQFQARNLASRVQVWTSPRLPTDPHERARLVVAARKIFIERLECASLL